MFKYLLNRQYEPLNNNLFYPLAKGNEHLLQRMAIMQVMEVHNGCVNTVVWDEPGNLLLSGSDDQHLVICDPWERMTKTRIHTAHRANIFSAKFMPQTSNRKIMSCSGDGILVFTDLEREEETHDCKFTCHNSTCYDIVTLPDDPNTFLTCGEDGMVRWFDLRVKEQCTTRNCQEDILLNMGRPVTAVAVNPITPFHMAVATQDSTIRIYDRRVLGTRATDSYLEQSDRALLMRLKPDKMEGKSHRVTALRYSHDGQEVLASYSSDYLYLFDLQSYKEVSLKDTADADADANSGPTLKRLRLRGDWSDTGPQALPESEMRNQAGDVGQARPTLHATLMQRMTDVLSRMLNDPSSRSSVQRTASESESSHNNSTSEVAGEGEGAAEGNQPEAGTSGQEVQSSSSSVASSEIPAPAASQETEDTEETNPVLSQTSEVSSSSSHPAPPGDVCTAETQEDTGELTSECSSSMTGTVDIHKEPPEPPHSAPHACVPREEEVMEIDPTSRERRQSEGQAPDEGSLASTDPENVIDSSLEGLQDRISTLRKGFVEKHQVEPAVNLTYSGQGVSSGVISLGVADEVTRGSDSHLPKEDEPCTSSSDVHTRKDSKTVTSSTEASQSNEVSQSVKSEGNPEQPSCSSSSSSVSSLASSTCQQQHPLPKTHTITTSSSSPAICDMEVEASSPSGRGAMGSESLAAGASSSHGHGARASELSVGPALDFGGDDSDDESTGTRDASARMASAIERAMQRVKGSRSSGVGGEKEESVPQAAIKQCYKGHRNARTMIKEACFWGDSHVMSGSDCGRVFVWERKTGRLVMLWEADRHVVNCLQPHPTLPVLATSGIDYDLKLWAPVCEESRFDEAQALEITRRNEALLEETRDTITVPATFMIRMLASLNHIRRGTSFAERWRNRHQARRQSEDEDQGSSEE